MKTNKEKLKAWFETLDQETKNKVALDCIRELIFTGTLCFSDEGFPYWETTGDKLDGSAY